jgi:branched-chain amino acid transport system ATP-binding protein
MIGEMEIIGAIDLTKEFGGLQALRGLSFVIRRSQIKALIGPNGSGKTTLFNLINGFLHPTRGKIFFQKEEITCLKPHIISRKGIGRTFQTPRVFLDMSVLENVMVGFYFHTKSEFIASGLRLTRATQEERTIKEKSLEILNLLNLEQEAPILAKSLPFAKMRLLEIGRALATYPKLLLMDEPSAGLNSYETSQLGKLFDKIRNSGITIFFVEHDMNLVMTISDEIIVLDHGEKIMEGTPAQIRSDEKVISSYLGKTERTDAQHTNP